MQELKVLCLDSVQVNNSWPFLQQLGAMCIHIWLLVGFYCLLRLRMERPVSLYRVCEEFPNGVVKSSQDKYFE